MPIVRPIMGRSEGGGGEGDRKSEGVRDTLVSNKS